MSVVEELLAKEPFSMSHEEKIQMYETELGNLTKNSYANCSIYKKILDILAYDASAEHKIEEFPFLPVRLFKEYDLLNVPREAVVKTMTSSGTTGQRVSKIYLDRTTSTNQTKVLTKICSEFLGNKRRPMLIIDSKSVLKDRNMFSARGAGIIGFSMLGRGATYALDEDLHLDLDAVNAFMEKYTGEPILLFGFTSIIWEHFFKELEQLDTKLPLDGAVVIHGGGWKKLIDQQVDNEIFKKSLASRCGDITVRIITAWLNRPDRFSWSVSVEDCMLRTTRMSLSGIRMIFPFAGLESRVLSSWSHSFQNHIPDTAF